MRLGTILTIGLILLSSVSCMKKRVTGVTKDVRSLLDPSVGDPTICPNGMSATIIPIGTANNGVLSFPAGSSVTFAIVASGCNFGYGVNVNGQLQRFNGSTQVSVTQPASAQSGRTQRFEISAYNSALQTQVGRGPFVFNSSPFNLVGDDSTQQETISFEPEGRVPVVANQVEFAIRSSVKIKINSITSPESGYIQGSVLSLSGDPAVATAVTYPFEVNANEFKKFRVRLSRGVPGNSSMIEIKYQKYNGTTLGTAEVVSSINTSHNAFPTNYPNDYLGQGYNQNLLYDPMSGGVFWSYDTSSLYQSSFVAPNGESVRELLTGQLDNQNGADLLFVTRTNTTPAQAKFYVLRSNVITNNNSPAVSFGPLLSCGAWGEATLPPYFILNPLSEARTEASVYYVNANNQIREARLTVTSNSCTLSPVSEGANVALSVVPEVALNSNEPLCSGRRMKITWSARGLGNYDSCQLLARVTNKPDETIGSGNVTVSSGSISSRTEFHSIQADTNYLVKCVRGITSIEVPRLVSLGTCVTYAAASGGEESTITVGSDKYKVHKFNSTGTLTVTNNSQPFEILVVGGGGGGGVGRAAGGGGAGGVIHKADFRVANTGAVTITVGAGGAASTNGGDSSFGTSEVAKGGGRGGNGEGKANKNGGVGGSGGGSGFKGAIPGGAGTPAQGNNGGSSRNGNWIGGGAGGGFGAAGGPGTGSNRGTGGTGGAGIAKTITGTTVMFAGGGGGCGQHDRGPAGAGGGGLGGKDGIAGAPGTANTGGGGGGCGGVGGSGVVIVRYRIAP